MKQWLSILSAVGLLLCPVAVFGQGYGSQSSQTQQAPPVAQSLVREGDFSIKLAAELDLGNPANETEAEELLAKADISPLNGWISDYPMTPEIIGQLKESIARSASAGKLSMTAEEATKGLTYLSAQMNLPTPAGPGPGGAPEGKSNPTVVNNYYYDQGPPVISYYPPPADYVYLYDWVPYPVFWFGFWFPGFFICQNFTTTVVVTNTAFVSRTAIVSNRFVDRDTRTVVRVDPVVRTREGSVRPMSALRTRNGEMFRTVADVRHGTRMSGVSAVQRVSGNTMPGAGGFRSLEARRSAQSIYSRSVQNMSARRGPQGSVARGSVPNRPAGSSYRGQTNSGTQRKAVSPAEPQRPYHSVAPGGTVGSSYRGYSRANWPVNSGAYGRRSVSPVAPQRPYGGRAGNGSSKWYSGNGMRGNGRG